MAPRKNGLIRIIDDRSDYVNKEGDVIEIRKKTTGDLYPIAIKEFKIRFADGHECWFTSRQLLSLKRPMSYYRPIGSQKAFAKIDWSKVENKLPTLVTIMEFALIKDCYPYKVYTAIRKGVIELVTVGLTEDHVMIDLKKYETLILKVNETPEAEQRRNLFMRKHWPKTVDRINELKQSGKV